MRLVDYVRERGRGTIKQVADRSGISYTTVRLAAAGMSVRQYEVAKAISEATDGAVTIADLCEDPPPRTQRRTR